MDERCESQPPVKMGFDRQTLKLSITSLVPLKPFRDVVKKTKKYQQILESARVIGLVEPPVVMPDAANTGRYFIIDGNARIEALKELDIADVECLITRDDDTFTYNRRVNRLSVAQDNRMIVRAKERGVSEAHIAETLGLGISTIRRRVKMLNGICPEVRDMLAEKPCPMKVFELLREVVPVRQIEAADLMIGNNNYSVVFTRAILAATPINQLVKKNDSKQIAQSVHELMARQEKELASLQMNINVIEETYGEDTLLLTVTKGYLKKLLGNGKVVYWLSQNHPEYLAEFQAIAEIEALPMLVDELSIA